MLYHLVIALGSGLASAVLFLLPAKGSAAGLLFGVLAPLPLLIAALGFGLGAAVLASLAGALLIALVLHPYLAAAFAVSAVFPALVLGWLAMRRSGEEWSSSRTLLVALVLVSALIDFAGLALLARLYPSYDAAVGDFTSRFLPLVSRVFGPEGPPGGFTPMEFARLLVVAMAPIGAAWGLVALAANLWLAARIVQISGRLGRPWPDLPDTLTMPRVAVAVLVVAVGMAVGFKDLGRVVSATVAAVLVVGFALHGLAVVHATTRKQPARGFLLAALYAVIFALFPWPLLLVALAGVADLFHPLRRFAPTPTKTVK